MNPATPIVCFPQSATTSPRRRIKADHRLDWAFEVIVLSRLAGPGRPARLARVEIEADLLGFTVRQSAPDEPAARTLFLLSLEDAILEAGRLIHERLAEGYVISSEVSD